MPTDAIDRRGEYKGLALRELRLELKGIDFLERPALCGRCLLRPNTLNACCLAGHYSLARKRGSEQLFPIGSEKRDLPVSQDHGTSKVTVPGNPFGKGTEISGSGNYREGQDMKTTDIVFATFLLVTRIIC